MKTGCQEFENSLQDVHVFYLLLPSLSDCIGYWYWVYNILLYWVFPIHVVYFVIFPIQYTTIQYYEKADLRKVRKTEEDEEEEEKHS